MEIFIDYDGEIIVMQTHRFYAQSLSSSQSRRLVVVLLISIKGLCPCVDRVTLCAHVLVSPSGLGCLSVYILSPGKGGALIAS
ncbi:hypothetical protein T4B_7779 [Trichinella pseudospiralis]|uniref:Uncharacterized protein n=2 Tax=Trichinella pseudospiralis TaxID=6337 RepID=A0A0V1K4D3_TRIPS|nr:hypothetical protein T4B_7779 [Trichinella pseudospiralis]KRZ42105.1 hypothetical protein T4C_7996 [Trichinella pseudospiralis]